METGGADATIRPWFWTLWLFAGPMSQSLSFQWYIFIATRTLVRAEGLITQLVFEHSLRIRLKAETSKVETTSTAAGTPTESAIVTPDNASVVTDAASEHSENTEHAAAPSQSSTVVSREPSSTSTLISKSASKGKSDVKVTATTAEEKPSAEGNLVGKINNLVTTDLNNVTTARDFLLISQLLSYTYQIIISICILRSSLYPDTNYFLHGVLVPSLRVEVRKFAF